MQMISSVWGQRMEAAPASPGPAVLVGAQEGPRSRFQVRFRLGACAAAWSSRGAPSAFKMFLLHTLLFHFVLSCNLFLCQTHHLEQGRAKHGLDIFKWLERSQRRIMFYDT